MLLVWLSGCRKPPRGEGGRAGASPALLLWLHPTHRPLGPVSVVPGNTVMLRLVSRASKEPSLLSKFSREHRCLYPEGPRNARALCCEAPPKELETPRGSAAGKRQRFLYFNAVLFQRRASERIRIATSRGSANGFVVLSPPQMPVCSYFLKGICSNSNCPYSHVYVSRKAEVCQDFLKGYCPMGEKVKRRCLCRSGRGPCRLFGVPASHELFFTRATAPKGAVELVAAEHLDGMSETEGFIGRVALFLCRQGKIGKGTNARGWGRQSWSSAPPCILSACLRDTGATCVSR